MTLFTPRYLPWTLGLLLFLLAFALRAQDLDVFLTPDETRWACRSTNFWSALSEGRWSDSYQKEHPGVDNSRRARGLFPFECRELRHTAQRRI